VYKGEVGLKVGRHDACIALRAVPVVEAMAAMTIMDWIEDNQ
jgi:chorismate synthase